MLFNLHLAFILLSVLWNSWICGLMANSNLEKFLVIIASIICVLFLSSLSGIPTACMLIPFKVVHCTWIFCSIFFQSLFSLLFTFGSFYWYILQLRDSSSSHVQSTDEPIKSILISVIVLLISNISFWFFLRIFISLFIMHLFLHVCLFH